jgi:hypothetical protein
MKIPQQQADALGGCQACQPATTPAIASQTAPLPSVMVVDPDKPDWIGISLVTPDGKPIPGEPFVVQLADGKTVVGKLDNLGKVRLEGVDPGSCKVTFPERDAAEWKPR